MKNIKNYFLYIGVLVLLLAGCSKEESGVMDDPQQNAKSVDLTFSAVLNDLANRSMSKAAFDEIPNCSATTPATAEISFSYGGNDYNTTVAILHDSDGYFTDYSEDLKIPVPNEGSVNVTLNEFKVFDSAHELIWAAPVATPEADFAGYVDQALPISFDVQDGSKPYIEVDVLCFDRRMANEYGYVFFDIMPKKVYPLCLFLNYCNADGRHYVANYSVDLFYAYGTPDEVKLYNHLEDNAMPTVGDYNNDPQNPLYYADPLCLVVPGKPDNLPADSPYLTLFIYPEDWTGNYGDIDNTPIEYPVSWEMIQNHLNGDGETAEYLHLLIGECEDALAGGGGGPTCNLSDPNANCDNDDLLNKCDPDNPNYATFDCDGDQIANKCDPDAAGYAGLDCDGDGIINSEDDCPDDATNTCNSVTACNLSISDPDQACEFRAATPGDPSLDYSFNGDFLEVNTDTGIPLLEDTGTGYGPNSGTFGITLTGSGVEYSFNTGTATVNEYLIEISDSNGGDVYCTDQSDDNMTVEGSFTYPIYVRVKVNICDPQ
ncbi:hypothetical protein C7S20_17635 [Christiangramia fulva]|uniref:Uncharacterized protein n=1 Tax=Christiangramia fulva TaxID=2126553 RepID=A0A2R3Z9H5_9FLAO|nr:hypothetical protein [Christiangramia fulva]AVR46935.1 hypothetical protein C7S20_17635 [Christiangramia fulva]